VPQYRKFDYCLPERGPLLRVGSVTPNTVIENSGVL